MPVVGPVLVIAGSGSGKTRVLTHRPRVPDPRSADAIAVSILAITSPPGQRPR